VDEPRGGKWANMRLHSVIFSHRVLHSGPYIASLLGLNRAR
jgi:hypothetical protein